MPGSGQAKIAFKGYWCLQNSEFHKAFHDDFSRNVLNQLGPNGIINPKPNIWTNHQLKPIFSRDIAAIEWRWVLVIGIQT